MIHLKRLYAHNFKQLQEIELHFPEHARILVQGKNEAGKSTLFEAVFFALFGSALVTEAGSRSLDDLIRYGIEKAEVELDAQVGARLFKIRRKIVRGKSNIWELDVLQDGVVRDEIRGNAPVNKRLIDELGFDGDALLNTCFVEQKKLEKLEGLSKNKREESLAKLLNLDSLVELESDLKVSADDRRELDRLRKRAELAQVQEELPVCEKALDRVEGKLKLIELRGAVQGATEELEAVTQLDAQVRDLSQRREETGARVERLEQLREAMLSLKAALDAHERSQENVRETERLRAEADDARRSIEDAPKLQTRARDLARLARHLTRLERIRSAGAGYAERAERLGGVQTRVSELRAMIEREEASLASLELQVREYEIGDALGDWIAATNAVGSLGHAEAVEQKQALRDKISRRFQIETYTLSGLLLAGLVAALLTETPRAFVFSGLAALGLVALAIRAMTHWRALARVAEELGQARAIMSVGQAQFEQLKETEARLAQLGVAIPETVDLAHSQRVLIARRMGAANRSGDELRGELATRRERSLQARAVLGELEHQSEIDDRGGGQATRPASQHAAEKADQILARWNGRVEKIAQSLDVAADLGAVQRARFQVDAQVEQVGKRMNDAARLDQEIARREGQTQSFFARAREAYQAARDIIFRGSTAMDMPEWNSSLAAEDYNAFGKNLRAQYNALGGEDAVKQAREIEGELGRREGERATRANNANLLIARARELVAEIGGQLSASPTLPELQGLGEPLKALELEDEATLRAQHRELVGRVHSLHDRQADVATELGLGDDPLDRVECERELQAKARAMQVHDRGATIVSAARRRIVQKVLPMTMDYMRQILPALTRDRYHDAQLDEETYKIQVWDERAHSADGQGGAFKEKNIFSGGTKDQFSLALRLAFALATMPQERGTAPSFIFLDEPLGSFDDERADALIYLLTEGEIAQAFDQIFLISHVRVDERLFTHRVVMENGRVAFTDLYRPDAGEDAGGKDRRNKKGGS